MNQQECIDIISGINECLSKNLWMDFEVCKMNCGNLVFSGRIDELDDELIEITFIQPFFISVSMSFSYDKGDFIKLIYGDEFIEINKKYHVEQGNFQFRITPNSESEFLVIAKGITVKFDASIT
ncbi:MAG: hypothetical protein AB9836_02695 [Aminipila sp.]